MSEFLESFDVTAHRHSDHVEQRQEQQARQSSTLSAGTRSGLTSIGFARMARALIDVATNAGVSNLSFRSPGRVGVGRAIRRNADGSATIAVRYRGRPALSVAADMIEGIVQAGGTSVVPSHVRDSLWLAAGEALASESDSDAVTATSSVGSSSSNSSPGSVNGAQSHSSAARVQESESGSGPPAQATRRAA